MDTPDDARFCPSCGTDFPMATPREERKFVSVLFVDLVGSPRTPTAPTDVTLDGYAG